MISSILLAAGQSKRMGKENKLSKKLNGIPLINYSVKNILSSNIDEIIIVLGHEQEIIKNLIKKNNKIKFIFNKNFETGIASSIKAGINNLSEKAEAFFICLGDMPIINKNVYNKLIDSRKNKEIVAPTFNGTRGNPILFSKKMKTQIMKIKGDFGAKKILDKNKSKIKFVKISGKNFNKDFNTIQNFNS